MVKHLRRKVLCQDKTCGRKVLCQDKAYGRKVAGNEKQGLFSVFYTEN
jgi:hypothetical protein